MKNELTGGHTTKNEKRYLNHDTCLWYLNVCY